MATLYPRQQGYSRQVFNYTLPDCYFESNARHGHLKHAGGDADGTPRMFVNPQQVFLTSPISPNPMEDYAFPSTPYSAPPRPAYEDRDPVDYTTTGHRRSVSHGGWSHGQDSKSYELEQSSGHRSARHSLPTYHEATKDLPTPPSSPSTHDHNQPPAPTRPYRSPPPPYTAGDAAPQPSTHGHTRSSPSGTRYYCHHQTCVDPTTNKPLKSFSRRADLQRHHACTHDSPPLFSCPRPNCIRKGENGFTRQDHLIEHRRGYHGEGIPKRGQRGSKERRGR